MNDTPDEKSKIIVDGDWKEQVQKEKEQLKKQPTEKTNPKDELPAASFSNLMLSLGTQTMAALGQFGEPKDGKVEVALDQAKHIIDTMVMLKEKTEGNLTTEEASMLENMLHQLRMLYLEVEKNVVPLS